MSRHTYALDFVRRILLVLAGVAAIHIALGIRPAFAAEPVSHELPHIRTTQYGESGPVAVLIPGMSTPGAVWDDTVKALSDHMRLLVVEVRGMDGERGTANEEPGIIDGVVADLAADLAARKIPSARIVGHSFGGLVGLRFGLDQPQFTSSLIIIDALPFYGAVLGEGQTKETIEPRAAAFRDAMLAQAEVMRAAGEKGTQNPAGGATMVLDPIAQLRVANWSLKAEPMVVAQALYEDMQSDLRQDIAALTMPITVLYQSGPDAAAARHRYETDYANLPSTRLVPVERTGHFIMLDRPQLVQSEIAMSNGAR